MPECTTTPRRCRAPSRPVRRPPARRTLTVAVVADRNHNGVYDDAPAVDPDANHDGRVNVADLRKPGVASNLATVRFHLNGQTIP